MQNEPRQFTTDEVRQAFIQHVWALIEHWRTTSTSTDRLEGLAFSILAALDGNSAALPGFVVAPAPHPDDQEYLRANGENWYPAAPGVECDIAGSLHELFLQLKPI